MNKSVASNPDLRKTLFQVMDVLIKTHPQDDPVYQFLDKKNGLKKKTVLCLYDCRVLTVLRIYYGQSEKEYLASIARIFEFICGGLPKQ